MPFVGGNLLLSHLVCIKPILQATSYEKTSTVSLCFPVAPGQRPSRGAQWLRQPRVTDLRFWGGRLGGVLEPPKVLSCEGARRQEVEGRWRGSAFFVEGCIVTTHHLSLPRRELRASTHIFLFNCFPPFSYITGKVCRFTRICVVVLKIPNAYGHSHTAATHALMLSSTVSINSIFEKSGTLGIFFCP